MDQLTFRDKDHTYWMGKLQVPNVTSAISLFAEGYAGIPHKVLQDAMLRGTAVHLATEYDDKGILDYDGLHETLKPFVDAWRKFRAESKFTPILIEERVYHSRYKYAGTLDRTGTFKGSTAEVVLDIKTGAAMRPTVGPQTAAYEAAHRDTVYGTESHRKKPFDRYGCELHKDGTYSLDKLKDPGDFSVFLASLTLLRWKQNHE